jgi:hypothetical protein
MPVILLGNFDNRSLTISDKPNCLTISLTSPNESEVYSYDLEGRFWTAIRSGVSYRRGLNGRTIAKWIEPDGERQRRWLNPAEGAQIETAAREVAENILRANQAGSLHLSEPISPAGIDSLSNAAAFTEQCYNSDVNTYHQVYKPVGILPPDQYMAVVLQASEGCSFNTCTFCDFYRDRPFRIKKPDEFRQHIQSVTSYLGKGMHLRRTVFLGDANALVIPMRRLIQLLDITNELLDVDRLGGIYAFLDGFSGERKTPQDYAELAQRGLKRVYIGMESGNDELLQFLNKPGKCLDVIQAVRAIKQGGVAVGVIVLLGAGGRKYARQHIEDTVAAINQMHLGLDDIIYFSELIENENLAYVKDAYQARLEPLSAQERIAQGDEIEARLVFSEKDGHPHISRYDIREFVY